MAGSSPLTLHRRRGMNFAKIMKKDGFNFFRKKGGINQKASSIF